MQAITGLLVAFSFFFPIAVSHTNLEQPTSIGNPNFVVEADLSGRLVDTSQEDRFMVWSPAHIVKTYTLFPMSGGVNLVAENNGGYACAYYDFEFPEIAHSNLLGYLHGGNEAGANITNGMPSYPLMKFYAEQFLCIYMPSSYHCDPPLSLSGNIYFLLEHWEKKYYSVVFWGHASYSRVMHFAALLDEQILPINDMDLLTTRLSYWPNHLKEIAVDQYWVEER